MLLLLLLLLLLMRLLLLFLVEVDLPGFLRASPLSLGRRAPRDSDARLEEVGVPERDLVYPPATAAVANHNLLATSRGWVHPQLLQELKEEPRYLHLEFNPAYSS